MGEFVQVRSRHWLVEEVAGSEAALDRNIELGVLIRHRVLATSVANHFQALIDAQRLSPLPTS